MIPRFCVLKNNMKIIGVELQKEIYNLAVQSVKINNLEDRITLLNMNVLDIFNVYETDSFDLITCNPPYFRVNEFSNLNNNMIKSIRRYM